LFEHDIKIKILSISIIATEGRCLPRFAQNRRLNTLRTV
jgi:hypothetical protein